MVTMSPTKSGHALISHDTRQNAAIITDTAGITQITPLCKMLAHEGIGVELVQADELLAGKRLPRDYDVALLDFPRFNGRGQRTCLQLRNTSERLPILVISDDNSVADRIKGFESGADDYIGKPFAMDEMSLRVKALLRRGGTTKPQNILRYQDLTLDLASRVAHRGEFHIDLSRREFALLSYFVRNAENVLSRHEILDKVWGNSASRQSNVVDVYVNYLRNKIDHGKSGRMIHTVRGKGYVLHAHWIH